MRIRTLIATKDKPYTEHISSYISENNADTIEVSVCNTKEQLQKALSAKRYDTALLDETFMSEADLQAIDLPLLLWTGSMTETVPAGVKLIRKHRRISKTIAGILEQYASVKGNVQVLGESKGSVTAVWSPCGGIGTTTAALALAESKAAQGKDVFYLNMESFASTGTYFSEHGKSISAVFEMLESRGNVKMLIQGIRCRENGISYLSAPNNFDDMCILSPEDIRELVSSCAAVCEELVIDLSCICDMRTRQVFELADRVLLITDCTETARAKQAQFCSQSDVFKSIRDKSVLVVNRVPKDCNELVGTVIGAETTDRQPIRSMLLPLVESADARQICKTLAKCGFEE